LVNLSQISEESKHNISIEEIEDYFLDTDNEYLVTKDNYIDSRGVHSIFKVEAENIPDSKSFELSNRIWNITNTRLKRKNYFVKEMSMERHKDLVNFKIILA
jgi:predicted DNA-binding protein